MHISCVYSISTLCCIVLATQRSVQTVLDDFSKWIAFLCELFTKKKHNHRSSCAPRLCTM